MSLEQNLSLWNINHLRARLLIKQSAVKVKPYVRLLQTRHYIEVLYGCASAVALIKYQHVNSLNIML